jgi:hypothetical protein
LHLFSKKSNLNTIFEAPSYLSDVIIYETQPKGGDTMTIPKIGMTHSQYILHLKKWLKFYENDETFQKFMDEYQKERRLDERGHKIKLSSI